MLTNLGTQHESKMKNYFPSRFGKWLHLSQKKWNKRFSLKFLELLGEFIYQKGRFSRTHRNLYVIVFHLAFFGGKLIQIMIMDSNTSYK